MLLVVQNDPRVPAGRLLSALPTAVVVQAHAGEPLPPLAALRGCVVLGGAMSCMDDGAFPHLKAVRQLLAAGLRQGLPLLGICLGGQLLAQVLGAPVARQRYGECGLQPLSCRPAAAQDALFSLLPAEFNAFCWHHDSFDLPAGASWLASSATCPVRAFRYGNSWALQFHPEVTPAIVRLWCHQLTADPLAAASLARDFACQSARHGFCFAPLLRGFGQQRVEQAA